jgi:hypothetical protein
MGEEPGDNFTWPDIPVDHPTSPLPCGGSVMFPLVRQTVLYCLGKMTASETSMKSAWRHTHLGNPRGFRQDPNRKGDSLVRRLHYARWA